MEKDATQEKLEKLHGVLETERSALREVLQAARKAVDDLKVEKQEVEDNLTKEQETTKWQAEEIERLKRLQGGDSSQTTILNQQIPTLNQTITELRQTITEHTQTINQLRTENSSLQQQLEDARRNGGNQQASDAENSQLRQTISDLQSQLDQFRNQQSQHQAELDRMAARMPPPGASSGGGDNRQLEEPHPCPPQASLPGCHFCLVEVLRQCPTRQQCCATCCGSQGKARARNADAHRPEGRGAQGTTGSSWPWPEALDGGP